MLYEDLFKKAQIGKYVYVSDGNTQIGHVSVICNITKYSVIGYSEGAGYENLACLTSDIIFIEDCKKVNLLDLTKGDKIVIETKEGIFANIFTKFEGNTLLLNSNLYYSKPIKNIYKIPEFFI